VTYHTRAVMTLVAIVLAVLVAAACGLVPFWAAIGVGLCFCAVALVEAIRWYRDYRRAEEARLFFRRECDRLPRRPEPTRREVLTHAAGYPDAWKPFVVAPASLRVHEDERGDWPVQVHAR
jgi:hypothetical protein